MGFLLDSCTFKPYNKEILHSCNPFDCDHSDLNDFFANDVDNYPTDSPEKMIEDVKDYGYSFPYLFDETQEIATKYKAACTPDFFLFDAQHKLYYRGQFDSARPNSGIDVTGNDMRIAVDSLIAGNDAPEDQIPSVGCGIKWKMGNQPEYA